MSYMNIYLVKNFFSYAGAKFDLGIKRNPDIKRPLQVLRIETAAVEWETGHVCDKHYVLFSPDQLFRSQLHLAEAMSENEMRLLAIENTDLAIDQINRLGMVCD